MIGAHQAVFREARARPMQIILFTKFFETLAPEALGEHVAGLGYDGLDLTVRPGYPINPDNVRSVLPPAARQWAELGLSCPMITAPTELNDPKHADAIAIYEAAAEAGVQVIKTGYFTFKPGMHYWNAVDHARRQLEGFEALSARTGVKSLYHTHSGAVLGSNCAGLMHLLQGRDPAHVGAYLDPGHLAVGGEDIDMAFAMCTDYLTAVAAKDARHEADPRPDAPAPYGRAFVYLGDGAAPWDRVLELLAERQFDGPLSVHTEYTTRQDVIATVGGKDQSADAEAIRARGAVQDLKFLRSRWAALQQAREGAPS